MFHKQQDDILPKRNRAALLPVSGLKDYGKPAYVKVLLLGKGGGTWDFWCLGPRYTRPYQRGI